MPDLNDLPLYNAVPKGNRRHSFTGGHVSILLEKFYTWKQHRFGAL